MSGYRLMISLSTLPSGAGVSGPRAGGMNHFSLHVHMARQPGKHTHLGTPCRDALMCLPGTVSCIPQGCLPSSLKEQPWLKERKTRKEKKTKNKQKKYKMKRKVRKEGEKKKVSPNDELNSSLARGA